MARILLSAYACEPDRGSEPAVGWNWACELSRLGHQVVVLTRAGNRTAIEHHALDCDLSFVYFDLPQWMRFLRVHPLGKPLYYLLWQWFAARHVCHMFPNLPFDVVQHVTYVSIRYPSFMGSLGIPLYFGPVSGGEAVPRKLRRGLSVRGRCGEWLRDLSNRLIPLDPLMSCVFRCAEKIIVTRDTLSLVPTTWQHKCDVQLAIGLTNEYLQQAAATSHRSSRCFRLLYVGRLLEWKGIHIALHAVCQLRRWHLPVRFVIVGAGPARPQLEKLIGRLELSDVVELSGSCPRQGLDAHYRNADLFLFPSLRDSGGMAVLEALAHGLPAVCTELGGPGMTVNEGCGRVLPALDNNPKELTSAFAGTIREIMTTPGLRDELACGAKRRAREFCFQNLVCSVYPVSANSMRINPHEHALQPAIPVFTDAVS